MNRQLSEADQDVGFLSREDGFPGLFASCIVIEYSADGKQLFNGKSAHKRWGRDFLTNIMQVAHSSWPKLPQRCHAASNGLESKAAGNKESKRLPDFMILQIVKCDVASYRSFTVHTELTLSN